MNCPICPDTGLLLAERNGVEIDYCPTCRGMWLDRGELDAIVQGSNKTAPGTQSMLLDDARDDHQDGHHDHDDRGHDARPKKKRGGFLSDVLGGFGGE